jgi:hypothetical protein
MRTMVPMPIYICFSSSLEMLAPCGRPRPDCPAQSGLTRNLSVVMRSPVGPEPADRTRAAPAVGPAAPPPRTGAGPLAVIGIPEDPPLTSFVLVADNRYAIAVPAI